MVSGQVKWSVSRGMTLIDLWECWNQKGVLDIMNLG